MSEAARSAMLVLILGWVGAATAGAPAVDRATSALLAAGDSAMTRLDLGRATVAYTRAHRADPNSYEAAWKLARACADSATLSQRAEEQKHLCQQAESLARAAVALEPRGAKGHAFLAVALGKLALFEGGKGKVRLSHEIKAEADAALALDPDEDLAHHVLGVWNREITELSGFLRFFATTLYGKLPQGSLDEALDHLRKAVRLRPDVIPHHVELGITLADARRYREAEGELEHALNMPTSWVTDDYYRAKAREALPGVRRRLRSSGL
jgi:tetratricopeptide (TPR) repeat protein